MKKIAGLLLALLVTAITMTGVASALGTVSICTDSPSTCASSGTITVYKDIDASLNPGLHALYTGWSTGATYEIKVTDIDDGSTVFGPSSGPVSSLTGGKAYYGWKPTKLSTGGVNHYRVRATGSEIVGTLEYDVLVSTRPGVVPELPTSALLSVGLIGLIGMLKLRKKD